MDSNSSKEDRLTECVKKRDTAGVAQLLQVGVRADGCDAHDMTPLMHACRVGDSMITRLLIRRHEFFPLLSTFPPASASLVPHLSHPPAPASLSSTPPVSSPSTSVSLILQQSTRNDGRTCLHFASRFGSFECVAEILCYATELSERRRERKRRQREKSDGEAIAGVEHQASVGGGRIGRSERGGHDPRDIADASNDVIHSWGIRALVNLKDNKGITPLHLAARSGSLPTVQLLLSNGAYVSAHSEPSNNSFSSGTLREQVAGMKDGSSTPLHFAARGGHVEVVCELLVWGADRSQRDCNGLTPFDVALISQHLPSASFLLLNSIEPVLWPATWEPPASVGHTSLNQCCGSVSSDPTASVIHSGEIGVEAVRHAHSGRARDCSSSSPSASPPGSFSPSPLSFSSSLVSSMRIEMDEGLKLALWSLVAREKERRVREFVLSREGKGGEQERFFSRFLPLEILLKLVPGLRGRKGRREKRGGGTRKGRGEEGREGVGAHRERRGRYSPGSVGAAGYFSGGRLEPSFLEGENFSLSPSSVAPLPSYLFPPVSPRTVHTPTRLSPSPRSPSPSHTSPFFYMPSLWEAYRTGRRREGEGEVEGAGGSVRSHAGVHPMRKSSVGRLSVPQATRGSCFSTTRESGAAICQHATCSPVTSSSAFASGAGEVWRVSEEGVAGEWEGREERGGAGQGGVEVYRGRSDKEEIEEVESEGGERSAEEDLACPICFEPAVESFAFFLNSETVHASQQVVHVSLPTLPVSPPLFLVSLSPCSHRVCAKCLLFLALQSKPKPTVATKRQIRPACPFCRAPIEAIS